MKVGLSTACFFGKENTEDVLKKYAERNIPVAEVFLNTFSEYTPEFADLLVERKGKVLIHSVHAMTTQFEPMLFNIHQRTREEATALFKQVCAVAKKLGAKYYTFHGPALMKITHKLPPMNEFGPKVRTLTEIAADYDLKIAYENVHWCYYRFPEFITELSKYAPLLATTLDVKQARQSNYDYRDYIKAMGKRLSTVHVLDFKEDGSMTLPTNGVFDYAELFERVYDVNPDANVMIEVYSNNYEREDQLFDSLDKLSKICSDTIFRR